MSGSQPIPAQANCSLNRESSRRTSLQTNHQCRITARSSVSLYCSIWSIAMFKFVEIYRLSAGSVFKLVAIGSFCSIIPLCMLFGVFALFGAHTLSWNGQPVTGVSALLAAPFIGAFIGGIFAVFFGSMCALGLWIYSRFLTLTISIQEFSVEDPGKA